MSDPTGNFVVLERLIGARVRPRMYSNSTDARGLHDMVMGVVLDLVAQGFAQHALNVRIDVDAAGWFIAEHDGRDGIEESFLNRVFNGSQYVSPFFAHRPHIPLMGELGVDGIALACVLSARIDVETHHGGEHWRGAFERGVYVERWRFVGPATTTGTRVRLLLDDQIYEGGKISARMLRSSLLELAQLMPELRFHFRGEELTRPDGLRSWVLEQADDIVPKTLLVSQSMVGDFHVGLAIGWSPTGEKAKHRSFVNLSRADRGGADERALKAALEKSAPTREFWSRTKNGFVSITHVEITHPMFTGSDRKRRLMNPKAATAMMAAVSQAISPAFWKAIRRARPSKA